VPYPELAESREDEQQDRRNRLARFVIVACVLVVLTNGAVIWMIGNIGAGVNSRDDQLKHAISAVRSTQVDIRKTQADGIVRGYKLRAVGCRTIEALHASLPSACTEAAMHPYFKPVGQ
jgi:hypothetical protein